MNVAEVKRVLIVGCGYLGSALGKALVAEGIAVRGTTATDARIDEIAEFGIEPVVLDVNDVAAVGDAACDCDAIFLCAGAGRNRSYDEVYVPAARSIAAAMKSANVRRVIYSSSTGVYAQYDGQWVDEESVTAPTTENGKVLVEAECVLLNRSAWEDEVDISVVRLGGIYGPGRELVNFARRAAGTSRCDGQGFVNLVHLEDICRAFVSLLHTKHHGVLNLCDDEPVSRQVFYDSIIADNRLPAIEWLPPKNNSFGKRVRNKRIKELLDIKLKYPSHC